MEGKSSSRHLEADEGEGGTSAGRHRREQTAERLEDPE